MSYFGDLVAQGATGTEDPYAAGVAAPADDPASSGGGWQGLVSKERLRKIIDAIGGSGVAGKPPADFYPQPPGVPADQAPIEQTTPATVLPPAAAAPQLSAGGNADPRVLAQLSGGPTYPAQDLGINLVGGPQRGDYADLRSRLAARQPAAAGPSPAPAAAPAPASAPAAQPAAVVQPQPAAAFSAAPRTVAQADQLQSHPAFAYGPIASTKPDFHDRLIDFGLRAMAEGGKPGANMLGALGAAGSGTLQAGRDAANTDTKNAFENRKLAIQAQDQISKAYERADALDVRAQTAGMNDATRRELAAQAAAIRQSALETTNAFRSGQLEVAQDKLLELQRHSRETEASRTDANATAAARAGETKQANADKYEESYRKSLAGDVSSVGMSDAQKEAAILSRTAARHPGSTQAQVWGDRRPDIIADAKSKIAAGAPAAAVLQRLQSLGISARDLQ